VAGAWSIADLFAGVALTEDDPPRIPDTADLTRRLLGQARGDPAVELELEPDHREALVMIRLADQAAPLAGDRRQLLDNLERYLATELRTWLLPVDTSDGQLSPVTRSIGQGLLAVDARDRILRACARAGLSLGEAQRAAVERNARWAALVPTAEPARLKIEVAAAARSFFREPPAEGASGWSAASLVRPAERARLIDELGAQSSDATLDELRRALAAHAAARVEEDALTAAAQALYRRLAPVRQRHTAGLDLRAMLTGAGLPSEGLLADQVRSATREAMGPLVGIPVARAFPGAFHLDALAVGGAANDRALSERLRPGMGWGALLAVALLALLLLAAGRGRGLLWLPVALSPAAVAVLVALLMRQPIGMMFISFLAGTLAGGAALAISLAARRPA
jgi:hypothetical protein